MLADEQEVEAALAVLDEPTPPRAERSPDSPSTSARIANECPPELGACLCLEDGDDAFSACSRFFNVTRHLNPPGLPKQRTSRYVAWVRRGDKQVNLGSFDTAEEAALCVASTPEADMQRAYEAGGGGADDERGGAAAGAGGGADAARGRKHDGLPRRELRQQARQPQALSGAGVARRHDSAQWAWVTLPPPRRRRCTSRGRRRGSCGSGAKAQAGSGQAAGSGLEAATAPQRTLSARVTRY
eukprot:scaffold20693_cov76-Phaeocystis_antarctica.AAC.1